MCCPPFICYDKTNSSPKNCTHCSSCFEWSFSKISRTDSHLPFTCELQLVSFREAFLDSKTKATFNYSLYMTRPKSSATYSLLSEFGLSLSPLYLQYLESFLACCSNSVNICWMNKWTVIFPLWPRVHSCSLKLLHDHLRRLMHSGRKRGERSACSHHGLQ